MILKHNCPACGFEIVTRYFMPGDKICCPQCNAEHTIPENAAPTNLEPMIFADKEHTKAWPPPLIESAEEMIEDVIAPEQEDLSKATSWNAFSVLKFALASLLAIAVVSSVLAIVAAFIMAPHYPQGQDSKEIFTFDFLKVLGHIITFCSLILPVILISISVVRRHHHNFFKGLHLYRMSPGKLKRYVLAGMGFAAGALALLGLLLLAGMDRNIIYNLPIFDEFRYDYTRMIIFTIVALLAPTFEEIIFRGYIFQGLKTSFGVRISAIVVTGLFILLHAPIQGYSLIPLLILVAVSITLIWVRIKTNSLTNCIAIHQIYNLILLIISWLFVLLGISRVAG